MKKKARFVILVLMLINIISIFISIFLLEGAHGYQFDILYIEFIALSVLSINLKRDKLKSLIIIGVIIVSIVLFGYLYVFSRLMTLTK